MRGTCRSYARRWLGAADVKSLGAHQRTRRIAIDCFSASVCVPLEFLASADSEVAPRPTMATQMTRPILYLDYDGVLHPEDVLRHPKRGIYLAPKYEGHRLFEHCDLLAAELAPYPEIALVLSTSWVRVLRYQRALSYLPPVLRERVVGATFHTAMNRQSFESLSRGQQVVSDVGRRKPIAWLAVDDDAEHWPAAYVDHLVRTDPVNGVAGVLDELRARLQAVMHAAGGTTPSQG